MSESSSQLISRLPYFSHLFLCLFILILLTGCVSQSGSDSQSGSTAIVKNLTIACTIPPQEEFIRAVGGDEVRILVMVPPGASPHTFEPTPSQLSALESADLYMSLGSGIEFENRWLSRIRGMYPDLPVVNSSEQILLMAGGETHSEGEEREATDPHIWLSVRNAALIVNATCNALSDLRPSQQEQFEKNRNQYLSRLKALDERIQRSLADLPSRTILVYHPAFGYFCQDYNLTQMSVEENGREPAAKSLGALIDRIRSEKITIIFAEPEFSTLGAETLAQEINGTMVLISPLSGEYLKNMEHIADSIAGV